MPAFKLFSLGNGDSAGIRENNLQYTVRFPDYVGVYARRMEFFFDVIYRTKTTFILKKCDITFGHAARRHESLCFENGESKFLDKFKISTSQEDTYGQSKIFLPYIRPRPIRKSA